MGLPTITQTWTTSFNNRLTPFVSLLATTGAVMFSWTQFLITTMGYTCKGSNSTSGGAMDGTNRITSAGAWATRNNGAAGAMSWIVLTDGQGIDWCWSYNSSSDDIVRLAHSTGGNYVAAATTSNQPTATADECFDAASGTWINATTSADRVWHMWATTDKKMFRIVIARQGAVAAFIAGEKYTTAIIAPCTATLAAGGGTHEAIKSYYTLGNNIGGNGSAIGLGTGTWTYQATILVDLARLHGGGGDNNIFAAGSGEIVVNIAAGLLTNEKPFLQGGTGELIFPWTVSASNGAPTDGKLGNKIDAWYAISKSATPVIGDNFGNHDLEHVSSGAGAMLLPGDLATTLVYT